MKLQRFARESHRSRSGAAAFILLKRFKKPTPSASRPSFAPKV